VQPVESDELDDGVVFCSLHNRVAEAGAAPTSLPGSKAPSSLTRKLSLTYYGFMAVTHIQLASLPVADQERALHFYVDVLGFDLVRDNPMGPDRRWVQVAPPGAQTSITLVTWFPTMPPGSTKGTVLETDALDADAAALTARGVILEGGIQSQPWGRFVTFDDPDGNGIVLQETAASA
jgi:catechol 2,3-dioxygenase-like lactoylglutathione lyase family enzyme